MKPIKKFSVLLLICFLAGQFLYAQNDRYQLYVVHEDHVNEGMMDQHKKADKMLSTAAKEHNTKDSGWITFEADDNRVMYLSPISGMKDLDRFFFEDLQKKMGDEAFGKLFDSYDGTYSQHGDYILRLDKELSYMPDGMTQTPEGENYRELTYYHIPPGKEKEAEEMAKKVREMYSSKNSKVHYRLYKSGFGNMGNYFMVAVAAESPEDLEKKRKANMELMGEDGKKLFEEIDKTVTKKEKVTGYLRPELSYVSND